MIVRQLVGRLGSTMQRKHAISVIGLLAVLMPLSVGAGPRVPYLAGMDRKLLPMVAAGHETLDVIIQFKDRPTEVDAQLLTESGFIPPFIRYEIVPAVAARGSALSVERIARSPRVAFVEHDAKIPYALNRAVDAGRTKGVWDASYQVGSASHEGGFTGRGVGVAIVDSGVDASHPDLIWKPAADATGVPAKTVVNLKMIGRDSIGISDLTPAGPFLEASVMGIDMADTDTTGGHGTHVAGIAAGSGVASGGKYRGAAPGANLIGFGAGETLVVSSGLAAFDWIHLNHAEHNIRVINNSWGGAGDWDPESTITKAVRKLVNEDRIAVVFAAGNSGGDGTELETSVWGNIPEVIQVANYYDKRGWLDDSSSRGKRDLENTWPDLAAPGTEVISTAAQGKPVTLVGTGQDALINELSGYGELNVVPAPLPSPVEADVAGHGVLVGNYASFTGTSMASPFVAGTIALMLEANPDLDPFQVKDILRETADMPPSRTYENDGFAIGKGVVDAGEAVAVALKMRDGSDLKEALRLAYVDRDGGKWKINQRLPRRIELLSSEPMGSAFRVAGRFIDGPETDQSIPFSKEIIPAISGTTAVRHFGGLAFGTAFGPYRGEVFPGEPVVFETDGISSNHPGLVVSPTWEGHYRIERQNDPVAAINAEVSGGRSLTMAADWEVPLDMLPGEYVLKAILVDPASGAVTMADEMPLLVASASSQTPGGGASVPGLQSPSRSMTQFGDLFSEDFEEEPQGWKVVQEGTGPGLLTTWTWIDYDSALIGDTPHSGRGHFYAGHGPGASLVNGMYYEDMADVSLISPAITVPMGSGAKLSYWRWGASEKDYDFLRVYVAEDGSDDWTEVDSTSGDLFNGGAISEYENKQVVLPNVEGRKVRIRFQFLSDDFTSGANIFGWFIDDVQVLSDNPVSAIKPVLDLTTSGGIGSVDVGLFLGAVEGEPDRLELDFGDGSPKFTVTQTAAVGHRYHTGRWTATLKAITGSSSVSVSKVIDVAPVGLNQVSYAGRPWVDSGTGDTFTAVVGSLEGIEARRCSATRCVFQRPSTLAGAPVVPPPPPVRRPPAAAKASTEPAPTAAQEQQPAPDQDEVAVKPPPPDPTQDPVATVAETKVAGRSMVKGVAAGALLGAVLAAALWLGRRRWT